MLLIVTIIYVDIQSKVLLVTLCVGNIKMNTSEIMCQIIYRNELCYIESDVWLTVHRNSVWIRKTN